MSNYIQSINGVLREEIAKIDDLVIFGENIVNGSFISGMTRGLVVKDGGKIINVGNCENTQAGVGFGLMMSGLNAIMFTKQLDFVLLCMDQFVNTYAFANVVSKGDRLGSFTVFGIECDQGLQGPQSSFLGLAEICSAAKCSGYVVNTVDEAKHLFSTQLNSPGFRIVMLSQRMWSSKPLEIAVKSFDPKGSWYQYMKGEDLFIYCMNASLVYGHELADLAISKGKKVSLFTVNYSMQYDFLKLMEGATKNSSFVIIDDSKSIYGGAAELAHGIHATYGTSSVTIVKREIYNPAVSADKFPFDAHQILASLDH